MARMIIDGYGQIEINNCAVRRDGRIEAQCALSSVDFAEAYAENGMILRVKKADHEICFADPSAANQLYALNYSAEHIYDERTPGLKNFAIKGKNDFLPRVGYLAAGDLFTTNCVDLGSFASAADVADALASGDVFAAAGSQGAIVIQSDAPSVGPVMQVIKKTTMPDGQDAFQFQVLSV